MRVSLDNPGNVLDMLVLLPAWDIGLAAAEHLCAADGGKVSYTADGGKVSPAAQAAEDGNKLTDTDPELCKAGFRIM